MTIMINDEKIYKKFYCLMRRKKSFNKIEQGRKLPQVDNEYLYKKQNKKP